ncbi:hypothetical protein Ancab_013395 [Ancistrocladus abbreviatus]
MYKQRCGSLGEEISTLKQQNVEDLTNMWVSNAMSANRSSIQLSREFRFIELKAKRQFGQLPRTGDYGTCSLRIEWNSDDVMPTSNMFACCVGRRWEEATSAVGSGVGTVGSGIGAGLGAIVRIVGTGLGDVGSGLSKAVRFMGKTITWHSGGSKRGGSLTSVNSF